MGAAGIRFSRRHCTKLADIFFGNCFQNGVLPIALDAEIVDQLFAQVAEGPQLRVDLVAQTVTVLGSDSVFAFAVDPRKDAQRYGRYRYDAR